LLAVYFFPFAKDSKPYKLDKLADIVSAHSDGKLYIEITIPTLRHTGHAHAVNGKTEGQYYYALEDNRCYFFLLSNTFLNMLDVSADTAGVLNDITVKAGISSNPKTLDMLISGISRELNWSHSGLLDITSPYIINELNFDYYKGLAILWIYRILIIVSAVIIVHSVFCIIFPYLDSSILHLRRYGSIKKQLMLAEHEMLTNILLKQGDFLITEHFLINLSSYNFMIMPLEKIIWVYKFSSYHILRYKQRKITYTLFIHGKKRLRIRVPYLSKYDANTILSYLATAYPDILISYKKEYEQAAKKRSR